MIETQLNTDEIALSRHAMFDWVGVGEVMLGTHYAPWGGHTSISGDVFNTLSVMAKYGQSVALYTAIGHDAATPKIQEAIKSAHVFEHLVFTHPKHPNGYYETRSGVTTYQRKTSACRQLIRDFALDTDALLEMTKGIYLSGITLAVCKDSLAYFENCFKTAQERGVITALDVNYRAELWQCPEDAWRTIALLLPYTDVFMPSLEDMTSLFGVTSPNAVIELLKPFELPMTVLTMGREGARVDSKQLVWEAGPNKEYPDEWMLGAGDAFHGGFLAAWADGASIEAALNQGIDAAEKAFYLALMNKSPNPLDNPSQFFESDELAQAV